MEQRHEQAAVGAAARRPRRPCLERRHARPGGAGEPARRDPCRGDRPPVVRKRRPDAARHDLPHRLHDQADHRGGGPDPGRAVQASARRSARRSPARARQPSRAQEPRWAGRRHGAGQAPDQSARSSDLHLRAGRRDGLAGQASDPEGDGRCRPRARSVSARFLGRRFHEAAGRPAARSISPANAGSTTPVPTF